MTSPLLDLHAEHMIITDAQERVLQLVAQARAEGYGWESIGEMLELTAEDAQERFTLAFRAAARAAQAAADLSQAEQGQ